jgi:short-subunit dehydrogenase
VKIRPIDFSKAEPEDYANVFEGFEKHQENGGGSGGPQQLRMIVNNAGVNDQKKVFELTPEEIEALLRVNIFSQVFMTKYARSKMAGDRRNSVIHMSSIVGDLHLPFHAIYGGTKAFNRVFGKTFSSGWKTNTPDTLVVKPSLVSTGMTGYHKDPSGVEPEDVVRGIMRELGGGGGDLSVSQDYRETNGAFWHCL